MSARMRATCSSSVWRSISARISAIVRRLASQSFIRASNLGAGMISPITSYTRSLPRASRMSSSFPSSNSMTSPSRVFLATRLKIMTSCFCL